MVTKPEDIVCRRSSDDRASVNVSHQWIAHSPTGLEFGYGGSGPADLALNILLKFGLSRSRAWALHQDFKWKFVAAMPRAGGTIPRKDIEDWISERQQQFSQPDPGPDAA